jgi:uncharacterized protein YbjT (DUF2867 family)
MRENPSVILIDGATGYVGSHLTRHLSQQGFSVRCLTRPQANTGEIALLKSCGAEVYQADLLESSASVDKAFAGVQVAIHLIGSIAPKKGETLNMLHVDQTRSFARLSGDSGVEKVIMVTALGTKKDAFSEYHRTKWLAEEELRSSGLKCLFIRPSLLVGKTFGERDSKLVRRFREMIASKAMVPLIGGGANKIQPLFIGDLVAAIAKCLVSDPGGAGDQAPVFELGGGQIITMKEFVQGIMDVLGYKRKFVNLPIALANLLAILAEAAQEVPILSRDQIKLSMIDNICSVNDLTGKLGIKPVSVSDALRSYTKTMGDLVALPGRG